MAAAPAPMTLDAELRARVDSSAALSGADRVVEWLPGGLTNRNLKVTIGPEIFVARLAGRDSHLLAIDRDAEFHNATAAASAGVAPEVVDYVPAAGLLVIRYVAGRTLTESDLQAGTALATLAATCRTLHAGPRFVGEFNMFDIQRRYLATVQDRGFRLPDRYLDFTPAVADIERALAVRPVPTVPCHNDLLAANMLMDDGDRIWLIDYEYAGNNDPCFELGNIWSESVLSARPARHAGRRPTSGGPRPALVARARLHGLMSKYGWMLWASIPTRSARSTSTSGPGGWRSTTGRSPSSTARHYPSCCWQHRHRLTTCIPARPSRRRSPRMTAETQLSDDEAHLASLGYKQELHRSWSGFSNFAISFSIISILAGCFTSFGLGWNNGGPAAIAWGWPIVSVFILIIGVCMSELVSAFPTSGGIYWWAVETRRAQGRATTPAGST